MMRTGTIGHSAVLATATLLAACTTPRPAAQVHMQGRPVLAEQNVNAAVYQHSSAEVAWLFEQGYAFARVKLDAQLAVPDSLPPAVIVDVDETVLDNSPYEVDNIARGRTYADSTWKVWTARAIAPPVPGALQFLQYAVQRGCTIFYITNRHHSEKEATITNLKRHGFPMADAEHVRTMGESSDKTERRDQVRQAHRVVLMVGDQLTDFDQTFRDRREAMGLPDLHRMQDDLHRSFILLPNSVYGYWRDAVTGRGSDQEKQGMVDQFLQQHMLR